LAWLLLSYLTLQPLKMDTDRRFRNVGNYKPDAGELP